MGNSTAAGAQNKENKDKNAQDNKYSAAFEEIMDIRDMNIKGEMLLSENFGKPREMYDNVENIAPLSHGLVKKVKHKITNKIRSMKIIKKDLIEVQEDEVLLFKELALLRSMDHPNIIKLYEFYRDEKCFYLISEFCEYGDMFELIQGSESDDKLEEQQVAHIMKQILSVVSYCHSNGIINRDLRPENILIDSYELHKVGDTDLPFYYIKINDFKSARTFKNSKNLNKKVGNPYYIAPEVLKRKYNEKCDIWSCGIIMYMLLSGKPPFPGNTDKEVLDKVELGHFDFWEKDFSDRSEDCKQFLKELLKYDPNKRLSAADALKHKWILDNIPKEDVSSEDIKEAFNNIMKYNLSDLKFQQAALAYIVHHLTDPEEIKPIRNLFYTFDKNMDGRLSHNEIIDGFKNHVNHFNMKQHEKELAKIIKKIDQDKSGFIEYEEFVRAAINKKELLSEQNLLNAFKLFDKDGSGGITPNELKALLGITSKYSDKVWNEVINQIEHNKENEVTYKEFQNMMQKLIKN